MYDELKKKKMYDHVHHAMYAHMYQKECTKMYKDAKSICSKDVHRCTEHVRSTITTSDDACTNIYRHMYWTKRCTAPQKPTADKNVPTVM